MNIPSPVIETSTETPLNFFQILFGFFKDLIVKNIFTLCLLIILIIAYVIIKNKKSLKDDIEEK